MTLDYFYGQAGELFSFFRIPKALFQEQRFQDLSTDAKTLYGILLDRMSLSVKNGWLDEQNRVFIIFTIEDVKRALCCADNKATKLLRELEKFGLIERKRRGLGKPSLVYVKNFSAESSKSIFQNRDFHDSGGFKNASQDPAKSRCNKTKENDTEMSETDSFYSEEADGMSKRTHHDAAFLPEPNQPRLCVWFSEEVIPPKEPVIQDCAHGLFSFFGKYFKPVQFRGRLIRIQNVATEPGAHPGSDTHNKKRRQYYEKDGFCLHDGCDGSFPAGRRCGTGIRTFGRDGGTSFCCG